MTAAGLVLAAGASARFGGSPKQLADLEGRPLLEHVVATMRSVDELGRVVVVLGAHAEAIRDQVDLAGVEVVVSADWQEGIAASLRAGVAALRDADAIVVALGDQPRTTGEMVRAVLAAAAPTTPARAVIGGEPSHPVVIPRTLYDAVSRLRGDHGAGRLLAAHGAALVEFDVPARPLDVDTAADLAAIAESA